MVKFVAAFATGIWAAANPDPSLVFTILLTAGLALVVKLLIERLSERGSGAKWIAALCLAWLLAGMIRLEFAAQTPADSVIEAAGKNISLHGTITGSPIIKTGLPGEWKIRYLVQTDKVTVQGGNRLPENSSGGVLLTVLQNNPLPEGRDGDALTATGKVNLFHAYHNPGQPDWSAALASRGIVARLSVVPGTVRISPKSESDSIVSRIDRWRTLVRAAMMKAMPDNDAALIMGMLFGGYEGIDRQTVRDFAATGIVHILSVSGAHIALVAAAVFWLTRRCSLPERWGAGIASLAMVSYGMVSGFSAPVVRSVIMGLICVAGLALGRTSSSRRALAVATMGMLVYEPRNLFDISFQLSVGCTAGLLYFYPRLAALLQGLIPSRAVPGIAATLAAQIGVVPFLAWYFGTFPLISLAANLLVVPILEVVILIGLLAAILAGGFAAAAQLLFVVSSLLMGLAVEVNRFLCRLPGGSVSLAAMGLGEGSLYYIVLFWASGLGNSYGFSSGDLWRRLLRRPVVSANIVVIVVGVVVWSAVRPGMVQVHFIDVGQGDATLIITPHGRAVLVDTGGALGLQNDFDVGEQVVVPYLRHYGVNAVDWLILTHNHQDHAGGAAAVAAYIGVRQALVQADAIETPPAILRLNQAMKQDKIREPEGVAEIRLDGVRLQLFQAGEQQENAKRSAASSSAENGRSTVVRLEYGRHSFLLTGDLEGDSEKKIKQMGLPASTVLKVGHHGARKSSQVEFLANVSPSFAVISVGGGNRFGHPAPETVSRLLDRPLALLRTDRDGAIVFRSNGETLAVERTVR